MPAVRATNSFGVQSSRKGDDRDARRAPRSARLWKTGGWENKLRESIQQRAEANPVSERARRLWKIKTAQLAMEKNAPLYDYYARRTTARDRLPAAARLAARFSSMRVISFVWRRNEPSLTRTFTDLSGRSPSLGRALAHSLRSRFTTTSKPLLLTDCINRPRESIRRQ